MAVQLSYPGVYVDEVESGVRTITGVATSITAFVGRCRRGPLDTPVTVHSYADFERTFGGVWTMSHLAYSVSDFFRLGGSTAVIVRVFKGPATATRSMTLGSGTQRLKLDAASPGTWGSALTATIDGKVSTASDNKTFNLTVTDTATGEVETFRNVSWSPSASRRVDLVVDAQSALVRVVPPLPTATLTGLPITSVAGTGADGDEVTSNEFTEGVGIRAAKKGLYALEKVDLFNLLVIPPFVAAGTPPDDVGERDADLTVISKAISYAKDRRAVVLLDAPVGWTTRANAVTGVSAISSDDHAAVYFPRIRQPDSQRDGQVRQFAPSGAIAGIIAATDAERGVWKAPAGLEAKLAGVTELAVSLTELEIGDLNPLGVNCLRIAPAAGPVVWGARTRAGDDRQASQWKYLPVRRTALFLEESLFRGMQWAVFEPNDEPLWAQIRLNIGAFLNNLFRQGAFQGSTPREAYFVKCDKETTTQTNINAGVVNIQVGFAPLKPAEFVVLRLQQIAGQITV